MCGKLCFSIIVICLAENAVLGNPLSCHSGNRSFYPYTGTKTPYFYVYNDTGETMTLTSEYLSLYNKRCRIFARIFYFIKTELIGIFRLRTDAGMDADQTWDAISWRVYNRADLESHAHSRLYNNEQYIRNL